MVLSSKPQIEREAGRSPLEAHTPLQYGPAKVTGWEGRDGREQTPGCQGRGSPFWAQGEACSDPGPQYF